jgi:hypothetical protein
MANEVSIRTSLQVKAENINFQSPSVNSGDDLGVFKGPCVGTISVTTAGTPIDFTQMERVGWCFIQNQSTESYVDYGIYITSLGEFFPLFEIPPGVAVVTKFSKFFTTEYDVEGTGTGTTNSISEFMMKARTADANVLLQCFDS